MAKFILQFNGIKIKEIPIEKGSITVGRNGDNDIVIDNLAVSPCHARVIQEGQHYIIEDLASVQGTFVNGQRVSRWELHEGDQLLIGKHTLVFCTENCVRSDEERQPYNYEACAEVVSDAQQSFAHDLEWRNEEGNTRANERKSLGVLTYIAKNGEVKELDIVKKVTVIGKGEGADIRVDGLFVGRSALCIHKRGGAFYVARGNGMSIPRLNREKIKGYMKLKDNDLIEVGSFKFHFSIKTV